MVSQLYYDSANLFYGSLVGCHVFDLDRHASDLFLALMLQAAASPMMAAPALAALTELDATLVLVTLVTSTALVGPDIVEFWLAATDGSYGDDHRATVLADESGSYSFESNAPPKYNFRPPHNHVRVTAEGFNILVTQHYPKVGSSEANFPLVLRPR